LEDSTLNLRGLFPLGETQDFTLFVLAADQGDSLEAALRGYAAGDDAEGAKAELSSLFGVIDAIEPYGPADRRGPGLDTLPQQGPYTVDIVIWSSGTYQEAQRRYQTVTRVVELRRGEILLTDLRARRTVLRARVGAEGLNDLLDTSVVEQIRTPPVPFLDPSDWRFITSTDIQLDRREGVPVGVLDDMPATGHPLLDGLIASTRQIAPTTYSWQSPGHHGTLVVGRVLFPHMHEELRDHRPLTATGAVHVARVLEPDPSFPNRTRFPSAAFPHQTVEEAIRSMHRDHGVKVFNLSFGYDRPFDDIHVDELTETIDDLIRELKIVVVVPTGNVTTSINGLTASGQHVEHDYPSYLGGPSCRLAEPAPAALAVTVGAISHSDAPEERTPPRIGWRAIAPVGHVAPFSRTGPGVGPSGSRQNKPDVVHEGGNLVLSDIDQVVADDAGVSIISLAMESSGRMFRACTGTSFAAPPVARAAADIISAYPDASANMVRALLAISARWPTGAATVTEATKRHAAYGMGQPNTRRAVESGRARVTMTYDGSLAVDTVAIHPIPMPEHFAAGYSVSRKIGVALAFDPPVRRQRREYLAGVMEVNLYRNISLEDLKAMVERQDIDDKKPLIDDRRRPTLTPGTNSLKSTTLMLRTWTPHRMHVDDGDTYYLVVVHRAQTWARDRDDYRDQSYAVAALLEDEARLDLDLHSMVRQQVKLPARVRVRP
jgi:hypothetical protein